MVKEISGSDLEETAHSNSDNAALVRKLHQTIKKASIEMVFACP